MEILLRKAWACPLSMDLTLCEPDIEPYRSLQGREMGSKSTYSGTLNPKEL